MEIVMEVLTFSMIDVWHFLGILCLGALIIQLVERVVKVIADLIFRVIKLYLDVSWRYGPKIDLSKVKKKE